MRVEQDERERAVLARVGAQLAEHDRVVAAEDDRRRARVDDRAELVGDLAGRARGVAGRDLEVAQVGDRAAREHVDVERRVVRAQELRRGADRPPARSARPARKLVAVSNGMPTKPTSTPAGDRTCGQRANVLMPV